MEGFAVAGRDKRYHPAQAKHLVTGKDSRGRERKDMKVIVLKSHMVDEPVHYRYAWARSPMGNIQAHHNTDIPMATQRSDDWTMVEVYEALTGKKCASAVMNRGERRDFAKALRAEDLRRRLAEARKLVEENKDK